MGTSDSHEITLILEKWNGGDLQAKEDLLQYVYDDLRRHARVALSRERPGHTLQPTALVHEAFLRLRDATGIVWQSRGHFFGIASRLMRQILVDHARQHAAVKRGSGVVHLSLDDVDVPAEDRAAAIIAVNETLDRLEKFDPDQAKVVEMRFFGGLSNAEIAEAMDISERTVQREWQSAKLWLLRELKDG